MSFFSVKKKYSDEAPSTLAPASGLASSQLTQQLQFPTNSQSQSESHLQSPQEKQQPQPVCSWSAHTPPFGRSQSPFLRSYHTLSSSATPTGELFLFGGYIHSSKSLSNDLYAISIQDFSTTLLQTSGEVPSPRYAHRAMLTDTILLIWGGRTNLRNQDSQNPSHDDSFYLLNFGRSELFDFKTCSS
jgi:Galactose oxidase, central domain